MNIEEKASISLKKVISISIILLFIMGIGVMATGYSLNNVKIILSDGYEIDVITSKNKISEILEENNIMVLPTESVIPGMDEELSDNKTIKISINDNPSEISTVDFVELQVENYLEDYSSVSEKVMKEVVTIAYETETKDLSTGNGEKTEKIVQNGVDGEKEIYYKVKFVNGNELEKTQIAEKLTREPVNCIKEIRNKQVPVVTSRSASSAESEAIQSSAASSGSSLASMVEGKTPVVATFNTTAYCAQECGGNTMTASGARAKANYTIATDPRYYPMGTIIYIPYFADCPNGGWFIAQDTGGAIKGNKIDVFMSTYQECVNFGRRNLECYAYLPE